MSDLLHALHKRSNRRTRIRSCKVGVVVLTLFVLGLNGCMDGATTTLESGTNYQQGTASSPEGNGKFYLGREIASVRDTPDVPGWLERPNRESEELPDRIIQALDLDPTSVIADIGAGTGYFSFRLSPHVPEGKVLAVDIQEDMIGRISQRITETGHTNVEPILGTYVDPRLPADSVDIAIIILSYHEFSHPREMMERIVEALKPGGEVLIVEYRGEDATLPISPLRRMTEAQTIKEMRAVGLRWKETRDILPQQHFMVFEKPGDLL